MNILVYVKEVPDTDSPIKVKNGVIDFSEVKYVAGPYDEYAVEEAIKLRDASGSGKVTLLCYGDPRAGKTLNSELAKGADEVLLVNEYTPDAGPLAVGELLARIVRTLEFDLILCGWKGTDLENSSTATIAARKLGIPHITTAVKIQIAPDAKSAIVHRAIEGSVEVVEIPLPAIITCQKGLNEPRYAKLTGIMAAKKKPHFEKRLADYDMTLSEMVEATGVSYSAYLPPPVKDPGKILDGTSVEKVRKLIGFLRDDEKVI